MIDRFKIMYSFLEENREYNHALQDRFYNSTISPYSDQKDKIISLLYNVANTQSQPKIDKIADTYRKIINDSSCLDSFRNFVLKINSQKQVEINFDSLYNGMKLQDGWGKKTAALFSKNIYHFHNGQYNGNYKIWEDVPETITENDNFYLPVDAVIIAIFKKLDSSKKWDFDKINATLKAQYKGVQIEVWDDLWFWGFITQHGTGDKRIFKWNENKYWALKESDKNPEMIKTIKDKAEIFLKDIMNDKY